MRRACGATSVWMLKTACAGASSCRGCSKSGRWHRNGVDPGMVAKSGDALLKPDAASALVHEILPLALVVTPNLHEASALVGFEVRDLEGMKEAARRIKSFGPRWVVVKGGHLESSPLDLLYDGAEFYEFCGPRFDTPHTHGTGCSFASAIAAGLALGLDVPDAVTRAKAFIIGAIREGLPLGKGQGPVHHFHELYRLAGWSFHSDRLQNATMTPITERAVNRPEVPTPGGSLLMCRCLRQGRSPRGQATVDGCKIRPGKPADFRRNEYVRAGFAMPGEENAGHLVAPEEAFEGGQRRCAESGYFQRGIDGDDEMGAHGDGRGHRNIVRPSPVDQKLLPQSDGRHDTGNGRACRNGIPYGAPGDHDLVAAAKIHCRGGERQGQILDGMVRDQVSHELPVDFPRHQRGADH